MKALLFFVATLSTVSAFAISSPLQLSKQTMNLAIASLSLDQMTQIVSVTNASAALVSVKYINAKGICYVQMIRIQYDNQGMPSVLEAQLPPASICK